MHTFTFGVVIGKLFARVEIRADNMDAASEKLHRLQPEITEVVSARRIG
jgi:hypothetical protein